MSDQASKRFWYLRVEVAPFGLDEWLEERVAPDERVIAIVPIAPIASTVDTAVFAIYGEVIRSPDSAP